MAERYLAFQLSGRRFGMEMGQCRELLKIPSIAAVPQAPECLLGVVHVRGQILPVFMLEPFVGTKPAATSESLQLLILQDRDWTFGLLVQDAFSFQAEPEEWMPHPQSDYFPVLTGALLFEGEQLGLIALSVLRTALESLVTFDSIETLHQAA